MTAFLAKPPFVRGQYGHSILNAQSCWFLTNDRSRSPKDALRPNLAASTLGTGWTYGNTSYGSCWLGDGTTFTTLGSANRFLTSETQPCTISWVECLKTTTGFQGLLYLFPAGATNGACMFRGDESSIGVSQYGTLAIGTCNNSTRMAAFFLPRISLTQNITRVVVVTCATGIASATTADFTAYTNELSLPGIYPASQAGVFPVRTTADNYFGWDNGDAKNAGALDDLRIWNRVLSLTEIRQLLVDPYVGAARSSLWPAGFSSFVAPPVTGDKSRFFLAT